MSLDNYDLILIMKNNVDESFLKKIENNYHNKQIMTKRISLVNFPLK